MKFKNNINFGFALLIGMIVVTSVMIFPFIATVLLLPQIFVTGNNPIIPNKGTFEALLLFGVVIQAYVLVFAIKQLYRLINRPDKTEEKSNELG